MSDQPAVVSASKSAEQDPPTLLELPPGHGARLPTITRRLVSALCHVDRLFRPYHYQGTWWLRLRDPDGPTVLLAPDYYLFRRVLAMEQLQAILEEEDAAMDAAAASDADDEEEAQVVPLFVWLHDAGPGSFGPLN